MYRFQAEKEGKGEGKVKQRAVVVLEESSRDMGAECSLFLHLRQFLATEKTVPLTLS